MDHRLVKSSSGESERRWVINTRMHLGSHDWDIEVTLTNRDSMGYRMLLGREAMRDRMMAGGGEGGMGDPPSGGMGAPPGGGMGGPPGGGRGGRGGGMREAMEEDIEVWAKVRLAVKG